MNMTSRSHRRRMGEILVSEGIISIEQLEAALERQKQSGEILGQILLEMGLISETEITKTLCVQYQLPFLSFANYDFNPKLVETFPREFLHRHKLLPFDKIGKTLLILVAEVPQPEVLEEVPKRTNLNAAIYVGYLTEVQRFLDELVPLPLNEQEAQAGSAAATAGVAPTKPHSRPKTTKAVAKSGPTDASQKIAASTIEIVPAGLEDEEEQDKPKKPDESNSLFGDSKESFLEELDSTWNSIFQLTESEKDESQDKD